LYNVPGGRKGGPGPFLDIEVTVLQSYQKHTRGCVTRQGQEFSEKWLRSGKKLIPKKEKGAWWVGKNTYRQKKKKQNKGGRKKVTDKGRSGARVEKGAYQGGKKAAASPKGEQGCKMAGKKDGLSCPQGELRRTKGMKRHAKV